jgi:hypothetical protein
LRDALWGGRAVEAETGLNFCVHQVRAALGDEARQPTYVATVPGDGYRFIAPVRRVSGRAKALWIMAGAAAAAILLAFATLPAKGREDIRSLTTAVTADRAIPASTVEAVALTVNTVASRWRPDGTPASHHLLIYGAPTDTGAAVRWDIRLVDARSRVLAAGSVTIGDHGAGAEAPWVGDAVQGLVTSWLERSDVPVQRFTRVASPESGP